MEQVIDEKKLLADLNNLLFTTEMNSVASKTIEQCIECVDNQPQADKWIPCSERLPELDEGMEYFKQSKEYLVTVQWWDKETNIDIGWYNQNGMWSNDSTNCKVIAWQERPLPHPYKKEGAE